MSMLNKTSPSRKLAAIFAADIAGYSALIGADEERAVQKLKTVREAVLPIVESFGGRIIDLAGDGVLAEFGSAVRAVEAASAVQSRMEVLNSETAPAMMFRIGINLGDVIHDGARLYGEGINIAARLEGVAAPGGICISGKVYEEIRGKLPITFRDEGKRQLKNIATPIHVYSHGGSEELFSSGVLTGRSQFPLPDKPSIAVLPFINMSRDSTQQYFAEGIAEDIITELSRYPDLFVVARNSSFTFRDKTVRAAEVAGELGVQYVLEGSVRRGNNRVRITAQLVDALSEKHLWAQHYDRGLEDVFSVQDDVTQSIVAILPGRLEAAALARASRKTSNSLDAYDCWLRGKYHHHLENREANEEALAHFDRSIKLDPHFASAYAWKACTLGQGWVHEFRPRTPECAEEIEKLIRVAISLDENDTECHRMISRLALIQGQFAKSEYHLEHALMINPNDPRLILQRGVYLTFSGEPEAAIPWIRRAMRIDPFSASRYNLDLVRALFAAERTGEALEISQGVSRANYEHYVWLAACHATLANENAAREAAKHVLTLRPGLSAAFYTETGFAWKRAEDKNRLRDALVRAGLPR